jgi:hypothetical protein
MKANVRIDLNNDMWVDVKGATIHDVQRACLIGGMVLVYHLYQETYCLSYIYRNGKVNIQFIGIDITKEQYETQVAMWEGDTFKNVAPGTQLLLVDDKYFI